MLKIDQDQKAFPTNFHWTWKETYYKKSSLLATYRWEQRGEKIFKDDWVGSDMKWATSGHWLNLVCKQRHRAVAICLDLIPSEQKVVAIMHNNKRKTAVKKSQSPFCLTLWGIAGLDGPKYIFYVYVHRIDIATKTSYLRNPATIKDTHTPIIISLRKPPI